MAPTGRAPACRDEDDRKYLHCAHFAGVDYLVSHDRDLLDLGEVGSTKIVTPPDFLAATRESGAPPLIP